MPPRVGQAADASRRRLATPLAQLLAAVGGMLGGAALIGAWCVGLLLIVGSLLVAVDALLRDTATPAGRRVQSTHEQVLERWRQAR